MSSTESMLTSEMEENMDRALALARQAAAAGEIPVGCVVVGPGGEILGEGRNRREADGDATAHAEMEAIRSACAALGSWRLTDCSMYVTLEPCPMCAGAVINARATGFSKIKSLEAASVAKKKNLDLYDAGPVSTVRMKKTAY